MARISAKDAKDALSRYEEWQYNVEDFEVHYSINLF
jgi:hypothetical protein